MGGSLYSQLDMSTADRHQLSGNPWNFDLMLRCGRLHHTIEGGITPTQICREQNRSEGLNS